VHCAEAAIKLSRRSNSRQRQCTVNLNGGNP
jgi:hypothetical protein